MAIPSRLLNGKIIFEKRTETGVGESILTIQKTENGFDVLSHYSKTGDYKKLSFNDETGNGRFISIWYVISGVGRVRERHGINLNKEEMNCMIEQLIQLKELMK